MLLELGFKNAAVLNEYKAFTINWLCAVLPWVRITGITLIALT